MAQEDADLDLVGDACEPMLVPEPSKGAMVVAGGFLLAALVSRSRRRERRVATA